MTQKINRRDLFAAATGVAVAGVAATHTSPSQAAAVSATAGMVQTYLPNPVQPVVEIASGKVRGMEYGGVRSFKGVPYGEPTFGKNRFMPPQAVKPWAGIRESIVFGPGCPGAGGGGGAANTAYRDTPEDAFILYRMGGRAHEDCLRLNVWAPTGNGKRPVLVYMHGGGYSFGSGGGLLSYDGENMARRGDAVVVTHNHRLNVFGFLDLSSFGGRYAQSANLGMQDVLMVLQWVRQNIAAFGGDPNNVTIYGQSGGGGKITSLMAMPSAKGLFHKCIIESGATGYVFKPEESVATAKAALAKMGVAENNLDKLADLSTDAVGAAFAAGQWRPVLDGKLIATQPGVGAASLSPGVPLLVGSNLNEGDNAVDNPKAATFDEAALTAAVAEKFKARGPDIIAAYKKSWPDRAPIEIWNAIQASGGRESAFGLAERKFAVDGKAWQYMFNWRTPMLEGRPKTFHTAESAFVSDNAALCVNYTGGGPAALKLAGQMCDAWLSMARNGDPSHAGLPKWAAFDKSHPTMVFDDPCAVVNDPEAAGRKLILASAK